MAFGVPTRSSGKSIVHGFRLRARDDAVAVLGVAPEDRQPAKPKPRFGRYLGTGVRSPGLERAIVEIRRKLLASFSQLAMC